MRSGTPVVGYRTGKIHDPARQDWDGAGPRPIQWSAWYPTAGGAVSAPPDPMFEMGPVARDAPVLEKRHPVVLLSHGTGGTAESLGWLAHGLAMQGHLVLGANHHGNCGKEAYRAEGFLCWWERAADCSHLLTILSEDSPFAGRMELNRVSAVGFSLGAYTVLAMLGAVTSMEQFNAWTGGSMTGPREFPDAAGQLAELAANSQPFRESWARQGMNYFDARVGWAVAIAPPPTVRGFREASLRRVDRPVLLITGDADREAPSKVGADWLVGLNPAFQHVRVGASVGHYTFLGRPTEIGRFEAPEIFEDEPSVERAAVHTIVLKEVRAHLGHGAM